VSQIKCHENIIKIYYRNSFYNEIVFSSAISGSVSALKLISEIKKICGKADRGLVVSRWHCLHAFSSWPLISSSWLQHVPQRRRPHRRQWWRRLN